MRKKVKKSIGAQIIESLQEFVDALEAGADLERDFQSRRIVLRPKILPYDGNRVKATRKLLKASQTTFAQFLGIPVETFRAWEKGSEHPTEMACRFMDEISLDPEHWRKRLRAVVVGKEHARAS